MRSSQLPCLSLNFVFLLLFLNFQLWGLRKLKKKSYTLEKPSWWTASVYVTEVHEALPRCLCHADVISLSLVLHCSAKMCSRSRQLHPAGPESGATESRMQRPAAPGRYCQSSASGPSRSQPGHFSRPETPGWSSQERLRPAKWTKETELLKNSIFSKCGFLFCYS